MCDIYSHLFTHIIIIFHLYKFMDIYYVVQVKVWIHKQHDYMERHQLARMHLLSHHR